MFTPLEPYEEYGCFEGLPGGDESTCCFYCGELLTEPTLHDRGPYANYRNEFAVQWSGHPNSLFLHPHCAEEWAMHLIKDVRSGELKMRQLHNDYVKTTYGWKMAGELLRSYNEANRGTRYEKPDPPTGIVDKTGRGVNG